MVALFTCVGGAIGVANACNACARGLMIGRVGRWNDHHPELCCLFLKVAVPFPGCESAVSVWVCAIQVGVKYSMPSLPSSVLA